MPDRADNDQLATLPPLRDTIGRHGLNARKSLGQHFLLDLNLTRRIAQAAGDLSTGTVIEIGPGPGGLTRSLLAAGARRLITIERDARCIEALAPLAQAAGGRLEIVEGDAAKIDCAALGTPPRRIVANLPYNISTVLLIRWLRDAAAFHSLTLMFQREVANRLIASPGTSAFGRLSVMANWLCETRVCLNLPARAFTPPPKVDSSVVQFSPRKSPEPATWEAMETVVAAAFGQRRKMLRSALKTLKMDPLPLLAAAEIEPTARAETLTIGQFAALARAFSARNAAP